MVFEARSTLHAIHATCKTVTGDLSVTLRPDGSVDTDQEVSGQFDVPIHGLHSGNALYDRELRRRLDEERYPTIVSTLVSLELNGGSAQTYAASGYITVRTEKRIADGKMQVSASSDGSLSLKGTEKFDMRDFNIEPPRIAMLKVDPVIVVTTDLLWKAK